MVKQLQILLVITILGSFHAGCAIMPSPMVVKFPFPPMTLSVPPNHSPRDVIISEIGRIEGCMPRQPNRSVSVDYENFTLSVVVTIPGIEGSGVSRIVRLSVEFLLSQVPPASAKEIEIRPRVSGDTTVYWIPEKVRGVDYESRYDLTTLKREVRGCIYRPGRI